MRAVKIEFSDTNTEDSTPAEVPSSEKLSSPLMPHTNPMITTISVEQVSALVVWPRKIYVNITLNTRDRHRATLSKVQKIKL